MQMSGGFGQVKGGLIALAVRGADVIRGAAGGGISASAITNF